MLVWITGVSVIWYDDQLLLVSLPLAQRLFGYDEHTATALRIQPLKPSNLQTLKHQISEDLGEGFRVLDRYEQQADFFRILRIEKLLTIVLLVFILLIASFNIIGSLSMLIIDKRADVQTLRNLGATDQQITRIFLFEGRMISAIGVRNVVENKVDFTKSRNLIVAAVILVSGLGFSDGITFTIAGTSITLTSLAIAALLGIILNAVLPGNDYDFGVNHQGDINRGVSFNNKVS